MDSRDARELPLGFGMALAQDEQAMEIFARLPEEQRQSWINRARGVDSRHEMQALVHSLRGLGGQATM